MEIYSIGFTDLGVRLSRFLPSIVLADRCFRNAENLP